MRRALDTWPPLAWLGIYVGSLFVLFGAQRPDLGAIGLTAVLISFGVAIYLAARPLPGRPPPKGFPWLMAFFACFYLIAAAAAAVAGPDYALAALIAGTVPATAATLAYATARRKTRVTDDGHLEDESPEDAGPFPGIGFDDRTPLGDSPELHDEITTHDLPPDHPARRRARARAQRSER